MAESQVHSPTPERTEAIIVAAGQGLRLGGEVAKWIRVLGDKPLFAHAVAAFELVSDIDRLILVVPAGEVETGWHWIHKFKFTKVEAVVPGGRERGDSVQEGLRVVAPNTRWIAIHDGARPFVSPELIKRVLEAAWARGAAIPAVRLADTIKEVLGTRVVGTIPRDQLRGAQTPQVFARDRITEAYRRAAEEGLSATDDAELVQQFTPGEIEIVEGDEDNFKVTTVSDWLRAKDQWNRR
jgi:2-C-methyl-D-erythritol 4-phosphate cytidylyltransferase